MFFAGNAIAWQSGQQPFATHSTAESELVGYCESLLIGRATESLLCAMWGEPLDGNQFTRVIYGDNMAAIGLAHGNTCSSWRTRHLRIRASILREAMEENCEVPGGSWRLIHLKGTELVADGLTKQLLGQSFERFREDLGLQKCFNQEPKRKEVSTSTTMTSSAAVRVLTAGCVLMQHAKAMSNVTETEDEDPMTLWTTGIILMVLGTIYVLQLLTKGVRCCLKRLWASGSQSQGECLDTTSTWREHEASEDESAETGSSEISAPHLRRRVFGEVAGEGKARSSKTQSGSHGTSSIDVSATLTLQSSSQSGSVASMTLQSAPQSGTQAPMSNQTRTHSGSAATSTQSSTSQSGSQRQGSSTLRMSRQSGSALAAAAGSGVVGGETVEPQRVDPVFSSAASPYNQWNEFQRAHKGLGWGTEKMRAEYYKAKSRGHI